MLIESAQHSLITIQSESIDYCCYYIEETGVCLRLLVIYPLLTYLVFIPHVRTKIPWNDVLLLDAASDAKFKDTY